jgi:hypothetical protein
MSEREPSVFDTSRFMILEIKGPGPRYQVETYFLGANYFERRAENIGHAHTAKKSL